MTHPAPEPESDSFLLKVTATASGFVTHPDGTTDEGDQG